MKTRTAVIIILQAGLVALIAAYGLARFMVDVPGTPHEGPPGPLLQTDQPSVARMADDVRALAAGERNLAHPEALEKAAQYIESRLTSMGYNPGRITYTVGGREVRNIDVTIEPTGGPATETVVVGASYDSALGTPGANDNASGAAVLLDIAYRLNGWHSAQSNARIRLVFFVNQKPPYAGTADMGSRRYAEALAERGERVTAMYALQALGYYSDARRTQRYPWPFGGLLMPERADFVAFISSVSSRRMMRESIRSFRSFAAMPSHGGVLPAILRPLEWSDHRSFSRLGTPSVLVTGAAPYRDPNFDRPTDTPDKLDYVRMTHVSGGLASMIATLNP